MIIHDSRIHTIFRTLLAVLTTCLIPTLVSAGQVVTPGLKAWAHKTVAQEKQLQMVTKPRTVAVLYFDNPSGNSDLVPLQKGFAVMLVTDLSRLDTVTVIERSELQALVEELGFGQSGLVDPSSAPRVGRLLQTEYLIGGRIIKSPGGRLTVSASVLDVRPAKIVKQAQAQGRMEQIFDMEHQLIDAIVSALNLNLSPEKQQRLGTPLAARPDAALELFKGIDAGDEGHYEEAAKFYGAALQKDPGLDLARRSLRELATLDLVKSDASPPSAQRKPGSQRQQLLRSVRNRTSMTTGFKPSLPDSRIPAPIDAEFRN